MTFAGMQNLTLLDFPGKTACTLFTAGCNFRCPFCHNAPLVVEKSVDTVTEESLLAFLKKRSGLLDGVCITGGEPTLYADGLFDIIPKIKELGYSVKLDTNGTSPKAIERLIGASLIDYVAMDIKNSPARYGETVGLRGFDIAPILESIAILKASSVDYEFRTTVVKELHGADDIAEAASFLSGGKQYFLQQYKDSENVIHRGLTPPSKEDMQRMQAAAERYIPTALRGV